MNTSDVHTEEQGAEKLIRYVLFVCNHNAGRSQMAQAFFERYGPDDVRAESAGAEPALEIWPPVVEAMREVGFDLSERKPKKLTLEMQLHADWAITMGCGGARVRSHVMMLAHRQTRECLRRDTCDLIAAREGS